MTLDLGEVRTLVAEHMADQPFEVWCNACLEKMVVENREVDHDFNVTCSVAPCACCKESTR